MPHGITLTESISGTRTISTRSSAIIGLIGTSTAIAPENQAAIDAAFPLDTPVLFTSAAVAAGKAGSGGTLKAALTAIDDIVTPTIIILRVAVGEDEEDQDAAVIGATDGSAYTGMQALLKAEAVTGYRPRIGPRASIPRQSPPSWRSWPRSCAALPMPARSAPPMPRRAPIAQNSAAAN
jgi:phage tail sheath protein FI